MAEAAPARKIVFSHANGFPAGTYRQLFEAWRAAGFEVHAIGKYGHDPRFPGTNNWPHLREQLVQFIEHEVGGPAYLVGHSLGGFVSLMAAAHRPDLASGLVLLDSPLLTGWKARVLQVAKSTPFGERISPAHVSKRRREHWDSADAAFAHFAAKPIFARWAPGVLADYVASGTEPHGEGQRLAFDRGIETAIYNALPHHFERMLRERPLRCEAAFVGGTASVENARVGLRATERLVRGRIASIEGSHLFPFEQPALTAATVVKLIDSMGRSSETRRL
jgi:pimeloyl-ACP methyl ester carboxylesterase